MVWVVGESSEGGAIAEPGNRLRTRGAMREKTGNAVKPMMRRIQRQGERIFTSAKR